jgi:hypothetical protein
LVGGAVGGRAHGAAGEVGPAPERAVAGGEHVVVAMGGQVVVQQLAQKRGQRDRADRFGGLGGPRNSRWSTSCKAPTCGSTTITPVALADLAGLRWVLSRRSPVSSPHRAPVQAAVRINRPASGPADCCDADMTRQVGEAAQTSYRRCRRRYRVGLTDRSPGPRRRTSPPLIAPGEDRPCRHRHRRRVRRRPARSRPHPRCPADGGPQRPRCHADRGAPPVPITAAPGPFRTARCGPVPRTHGVDHVHEQQHDDRSTHRRDSTGPAPAPRPRPCCDPVHRQRTAPTRTTTPSSSSRRADSQRYRPLR